jgi:hypothetical protein
MENCAFQIRSRHMPVLEAGESPLTYWVHNPHQRIVLQCDAILHYNVVHEDGSIQLAFI